MTPQCFTGQFDNDQAGYAKALNWFSCLRPPTIEDKLWAACITVLGEAFENAVYHAKTPLARATPTSLEVIITDAMIQMRIWDSGPGFNLEQHIKDLPDSVPICAERGRGLWIIKQMSDHLSYIQTADRLNCLTIQKKWSPSDEMKADHS